MTTQIKWHEVSKESKEEILERLKREYAHLKVRDFSPKKVSLIYFKRKLGKSAFLVWECLKYFSGADKEVKLKRSKIEQYTGLSESQTIRALYKLKKLEIITKAFQNSRCAATRYVFCDRVGDEEVLIGKRNYEAMEGTLSRGGDRRSDVWAESRVDTIGGGVISSDTNFSVPKNQTVTPESVSIYSNKKSVLLSKERSPRDNQDCLSEPFLALRAAGIEENEQETMTASKSRACDNFEIGDTSPLSDVGNLVTKLRHDPYEREIKGFLPRHDLIPPYPGISKVPMARFPDPPRIQETMTDEEKVIMCIQAFRGACERTYGKKCYDMRVKPENLKKHKNYSSLLKSANYLQEKRVSPHVWAMWELDRIEGYKEKLRSEGKPVPKSRRKNPWPPMYIIFAMKTIQKRIGWCRAESRDYTAGALTFTPEHLDLITRWQKMRVELTRTDDSVENIKAVVEKHFPGDLYDRLVRIATDKAMEQQRIWEDHVKRGKFIW